MAAITEALGKRRHRGIHAALSHASTSRGRRRPRNSSRRHPARPTRYRPLHQGGNPMTEATHTHDARDPTASAARAVLKSAACPMRTPRGSAQTGRPARNRDVHLSRLPPVSLRRRNRAGRAAPAAVRRMIVDDGVYTVCGECGCRGAAPGSIDRDGINQAAVDASAAETKERRNPRRQRIAKKNGQSCPP